MSKNLHPSSRPRQMEFCFEGDEVWQQLPPAIGRECVALLVQLLSAVICEESQAREVKDHE